MRLIKKGNNRKMATGKSKKSGKTRGRKRFNIRLRAARNKDLTNLRKDERKKTTKVVIPGKSVKKAIEAYKKSLQRYEEEIFKGVNFTTNTGRLFDIIPKEDDIDSLFDVFHSIVNNTVILDRTVDIDIYQFYGYDKINLNELHPDVDPDLLRRYGKDLDVRHPEDEKIVISESRGVEISDYQYPIYVLPSVPVMSAPVVLTPSQVEEVEEFKQVLAFYSDPLHDFKANRMDSLSKDSARFVELYIEHLVNETQRTLSKGVSDKISLINNAENITFNNIFNRVVDVGSEMKSNIMLQMDVSDKKIVERVNIWAKKFLALSTQLIRDAAGTVYIKRAGFQPSETDIPFERAFDAAGRSDFTQSRIVDYATHILRYPDNLLINNDTTTTFLSSGVTVSPSLVGLPTPGNKIKIVVDKFGELEGGKASVPNVGNAIVNILTKNGVSLKKTLKKGYFLSGHEGLPEGVVRQIWTLLNLKRAGDQGQVEYAIAKSTPQLPVFIETSDYMAAVYGLLVRANLITKFKEPTKSGKTYVLIRNFASELTIEDARKIFAKVYSDNLSTANVPLNQVLASLYGILGEVNNTQVEVVLGWVKTIESYNNFKQFYDKFVSNLSRFFTDLQSFSPTIRNMLRYGTAVKLFLDSNVQGSYGKNAMVNFANVLVAFSTAVLNISNSTNDYFGPIKQDIKLKLSSLFVFGEETLIKVNEFVSYIRNKKDVLKTTLSVIARSSGKSSTSKLLDNFDLYESYVDSLFELVVSISRLVYNP